MFFVFSGSHNTGLNVTNQNVILTKYNVQSCDIFPIDRIF